MTRNISGYIFLLLYVFFFRASAKIEEIVDPEKIQLLFHNCNNTDKVSNECNIHDTNCIEYAYNQIRKNKSITVLAHGYLGGRNTLPTPYVISAYCSRNTSAIILLDWSRLARGDMLMVSNRIPEIGRIVASSFDILKRRGYELENWHLIGHSMGAHIVGCVGTYTYFNFSHITGLDPAELFFYSDLYDGCQINSNVAQFTEVFYTDSGGYGTMKEVGTVNIYANTGSAPQPACCHSQYGINGCSHIKAAEWYADAVRNETKYLATRCANCFAFMNYAGYCRENERIYFGPRVNKTASGTYCLVIN
ncbi:hypothetical protein P5V15_004111 [Pogonomyrmex californicus]